MSLYLGIDLGGPELRGGSADSAITRIAKRVRDARPSEPPDTGKLNIVFLVPGSLYKPDFEGVRTGRFSRKEMMLLAEAAVPSEFGCLEDLESFVFASIRDSVRLARPVFEKAGIHFSEEDEIAFLERIEGSMVH